MAQFTGYVCDVCERVGRNREGWLSLEPSSGGHFDICSDKCLLVLARSRVKGDAPNPGPRRQRNVSSAYSDEFKTEVVGMANATSVREAADHYGVSWQLVTRWRSEAP